MGIGRITGKDENDVYEITQTGQSSRMSHDVIHVSGYAQQSIRR